MSKTVVCLIIIIILITFIGCSSIEKADSTIINKSEYINYDFSSFPQFFGLKSEIQNQINLETDSMYNVDFCVFSTVDSYLRLRDSIILQDNNLKLKDNDLVTRINDRANIYINVFKNVDETNPAEVDIATQCLGLNLLLMDAMKFIEDGKQNEFVASLDDLDKQIKLFYSKYCEEYDNKVFQDALGITEQRENAKKAAESIDWSKIIDNLP